MSLFVNVVKNGSITVACHLAIALSVCCTKTINSLRASDFGFRLQDILQEFIWCRHAIFIQTFPSFHHYILTTNKNNNISYNLLRLHLLIIIIRITPTATTANSTTMFLTVFFVFGVEVILIINVVLGDELLKIKVLITVTLFSDWDKITVKHI